MAARTHRCWFGSRIHPRTRNNHCPALLQKPFFLPQTPKMVTTQATSKRPTCPSCSKPVRLCLCTRIQTPGLPNSVSVTILQHSLEKNHPLNSTRIARLGLKNLNVVTVSDVNFEARFVIRTLDSDTQTVSDRNDSKCSGLADQVGESGETQKLAFGYCEEGSSGKKSVSESELGVSANFFKEKNTCSLIDCDEKFGGINSVNNSGLSSIDAVEGVQSGNSGPAITATIGKYGAISSFSHIWMPQIHSKDPKFDTMLDITDASDILAEGFVVQKLQKRPLEGIAELDEHVEFEVEVPPGSVLLFPSEEAVGVGELEAMDVEVKNLIVLDGTWAKAKRMYVENPWLKLLPHLKLDLDKMSLYNGVRLPPKPGFLSTIESIVYALKAVGDCPEGLDNLLDVFESMVEDQKRCKEERLSSDSLG